MTLTRIPDSSANGPHPLLQAAADLHHRHAMAFEGFDDATEPPEQLAAALAPRPDVTVAMWMLPGAAGAAASMVVRLPQADNQHLAELDMLVDPELKPGPILDQLWPVAQDFLREHGRTTAEVYLDQRPEESETHETLPADSGGVFALTGEVQWYLDNGFTLQQIERRSTLTIAEANAAELEVPADYEVITWTGPTPKELRDQVAPLRAAMSTDIPLGGSSLQPEQWDGERVARADESAAARGRDRVWGVVRHRPSGELVGHSFVWVARAQPQAAFQEDTLIRRDHRGHGLGLAVKRAVLAELRRTCAQVQRIHTWNADENQHMLAINAALGFRVTAHSGMLDWRV